jgi:hypothetical protein
MTPEEIQDRVSFLDRKNKELKNELKKKDERISDLTAMVKVLRRLNGENQNA